MRKLSSRARLTGQRRSEMEFEFSVSNCPNSGAQWVMDGEGGPQSPLDIDGCSVSQCWLCGSVLYDAVGADGISYGGHP